MGGVHPERISPSDRPLSRQAREAILSAPVFGESFSDHMVTMRWANGEWGPLELAPFAPLSLSPATLALHYGQSIFEALKAYALTGGAVALFRPDRNAARMAASAERIAMPSLPDGVFEQACELLVDADREWVPTQDGSALYVRPFMFGSEAHLSVRPAHEYLFVVIASPVASYFGGHLRAIRVAVESRDVRATPGGTGAAKFAGNYAAGFAAHGRAGAAGHDQVLWLDAVEHRWVEELNAMNVMFVWERDGRRVLSSPPLGGTILDGVTRDSLLCLAEDSLRDPAGSSAVEEVSIEATSIDALEAGAQDGTLVEAFACGTAAVVAPIGSFVVDGRVVEVGDGSPGPVTVALRHRLLDVQGGRVPDVHGWLRRVERRPGR
ncbi:MAG: branched-chain amino acid aminotransferase [Microthrixaceae bacterium]